MSVRRLYQTIKKDLIKTSNHFSETSCSDLNCVKAVQNIMTPFGSLEQYSDNSCDEMNLRHCLKATNGAYVLY